MSRLELHRKEVKSALVRAWGKTNTALGPKFRAETESSKWPWPWPRATQRRSGQRVTSPRDVVDRGDFRDSYNHRGRGVQQEHAWSAPHSAVVILGARLKNGTLLPSRNVTLEPLKQLEADYAKTASDEFS